MPMIGKGSEALPVIYCAPMCPQNLSIGGLLTMCKAISIYSGLRKIPKMPIIWRGLGIKRKAEQGVELGQKIGRKTE